MSSYEYAVIPAPSRAEKTKGAKTGIDRFAATLTASINDMARDGWEYVRAETLPAEERSGLTSRTTVYHNLLVFRRPVKALKTHRETAPPQMAEPHPEPEAQPAEPAARGPFTAPMRPAPQLAEENHARARMTDPPLTAPETPTPTGPRLGPANR